MKATTLLITHHRQVEALFKELEAAPTAPAQLVRAISDHVAAHMEIEQDILYPAVRGIDDRKLSEGYEEHALSELALKRLCDTNPRDEAFVGRVIAARELIVHHQDEEEEDLFPKLNKELSSQRLEALAERMKQRFEEACEQGYQVIFPKIFARTSADQARRRNSR